MGTNVLISGMPNPFQPPGKIIYFLRSDVLQLVVDDRVIAEYIDVLGRKYFLKYYTESNREDIIEYLSKNPHYSSNVSNYHIH